MKKIIERRMKYAELKEMFRNHEQQNPVPNEGMIGYIVFTEDSYTEKYSLESRTYAVSSKNKAFMPDMGGYSIYGSSIDGSDPMVRLEAYMASEKGGPKGWKVDYCYIKEEVDVTAQAKKNKSFKDIQNEVIEKYRINNCPASSCWGRTHAHVRERKVCKWKQANSIESTFTLFHEIGHIENNNSKMRRYEEEYYATIWAIKLCEYYGLKIPSKIIRSYQDYIDMERDRGLRRNGSNMPELKLPYIA